MAKIVSLIPSQAFELIRDRIADILIDEFNNQFIISYDAAIDVAISVESSTSVDKTEPTKININLQSADFNNKNQGAADGLFIYNIDCYTKSKSTNSEDGDVSASKKLQRIIGMCYAILSDPQYRTLGYAAPFIQRVSCGIINIADPGKQDASNIMMGRFTLTVQASQTNPLIVPGLLEGYETTVKMGESESGYHFIGENY